MSKNWKAQVKINGRMDWVYVQAKDPNFAKALIESQIGPNGKILSAVTQA